MIDPRFESHLIRAVIAQNDLIDQCPLQPDDFQFYRPQWEKILTMRATGAVIDYTTLPFDPVPLMSDFDAHVSPLFFPEYCRRVREQKIIRDIQTAVDLDEVAKIITRRLVISDGQKDVVSEFFEEYNKRRERMQDGYIGIKTGFSWVDKRVVFREGDLITIAARPGQGKTAFAMNLAMGIAEKKRVLYLSLEMSEHEMMCRSLACFEDRQLSDFSTLREENIGGSLGRWLQKYPHLNFRHPRVCTLAVINEIAPRYDCIIVDQLSCIQEVTQKGETKAALFGRITAGLKQIANQYNIPVILCAQINRQGTDEPQLHHLKDSGSIEEDSAVVLILHSANNDSPTRIICAKNRGGEADHDQEFTFRRSHMKFIPQENL